MVFSEVKVTERQQNAGPCGRFTVRERSDKVTVRAGSMMAKLSLCLGVLLIALVLELGALYFVEVKGETSTAQAQMAGVQRAKWAPPVLSDEVTLLREDSVVGFSALNTDVSCCCAGQVFAVGEDEDWGKYVRIRSAGDIDAVYYGFEEVKVRAGETVAAGQLLGTVPVGRRVYFAVSEKGAPQDPRAYVSLTVQKQA